MCYGTVSEECLEVQKGGTDLVEKRRHLLLVAWKAVEKEDPGALLLFRGDLRLNHSHQSATVSQVSIAKVLASGGRESAFST